MQIDLKILTPRGQIVRDIGRAIEKHMTKSLSGIGPKIEKRARLLIHSALMNSPVVSSLESGELKGELGVVNASSDLFQIFKSIADETKVTTSKPRFSSNGMNFTLRLTAVPIDLDSVIAGLGSYTTKKGAEIPWFQWLTELGDAVIVRDYVAETGHPKVSRTGDKIMVKAKGGWRVPPQFAGIKGDNFVTKATDEILPELENFIKKEIA